ncbi:hypothetical protein FHP29_00725 [Nocardioides albidus]|uniref:Uncharacterized protein n=1 Tax=Nocardioides albidus TaxID=1517589 RepID=A0A5C4WQG5_9ACTN|nr:hypothetical protein [Nocardioides albidus]TNM50192.1 hypothetical protein FHP29_00725 [Nocardioides albidus]
MSIEELRATLHQQVSGLVDDDVAGRADAARDRARDIVRRRRITAASVAAALVAVALLGAALLGLDPLRRSAPVVEVPQPDQVGVDAFAGRTPLESRESHDGSEVTLSHDADGPTQWTATCFGVGADYTLHATLDGASPGEAPCEVAEPPEALLGYVLDDRFADGKHTLRLWITRTGSGAVTAPDAVLVAGVFRLPEPVAVVAGVGVYDVERVFDPSRGTLREWAYAGSQESQPGDRRLDATHESSTQMVAQLVVPDVEPGVDSGVDPGVVRLLVDGVEVDAGPVLAGSGYLAPLPPGRHTVSVRLRGGPDQPRPFGVVWREVRP